MRSIHRRIEVSLAAPWLALALLGGATGCNEPLADPIPSASPEPIPRRGGTLHLASFGDIHVLDPAVSNSALQSAAIEHLFAGLVDFDPTGNVVPDLASRYEVSDDGLTYRFFLREGARFHDGEEVTADDVRRSIERALHPTTPNPMASSFETILGYADYTEKGAPHLAGVIVEGRYVVAIRLRERDSRFLATLALQSVRPVCKSGGERYTDTWAPCGAGPFRLLPGGWDRGRSLTIVRHEGYFRPGLPYLDAVNWTYGINIIAERFKFEDGDLDVVRDLSQADTQRFQRDPRWKPFGEYEPARTVAGEAMNTELAPFDNVEVRRAVAAAIDRDHYCLVRPANMRPAFQVIPPGVAGYDPAFQGQTHDRDAALEHMKRAGYPYDPATGRGGYEPTITYYAYRQGLNESTAQILQQELAQIGLRLDLKLVSFPTYLALGYRRKAIQMSSQAWNQDYPDASDFFEALFSSKAINEEQSTNSAFYKNPRLDEILEEARHELDPKRRFSLYGDANAIVRDDAPWAFTFHFRFYLVHQPYVHAYRPHLVWDEYLTNTWMDRAPVASASNASVSPSWRSLTGFWGKTRHSP